MSPSQGAPGPAVRLDGAPEGGCCSSRARSPGCRGSEAAREPGFPGQLQTPWRGRQGGGRGGGDGKASG